MTALERLLAEALPTGTFGDARPSRSRNTAPAPAWTADEQAAHLAVLEAALDGVETPRRPRFTVIDGQAAA